MTTSGFSRHQYSCLLPNALTLAFRHTIATAQLEEKLAGAHKKLGELRAQEASLQREQKKADTHKKMTEF